MCRNSTLFGVGPIVRFNIWLKGINEAYGWFINHIFIWIYNYMVITASIGVRSWNTWYLLDGFKNFEWFGFKIGGPYYLILLLQLKIGQYLDWDNPKLQSTMAPPCLVGGSVAHKGYPVSHCCLPNTRILLVIFFSCCRSNGVVPDVTVYKFSYIVGDCTQFK